MSSGRIDSAQVLPSAELPFCDPTLACKQRQHRGRRPALPYHNKALTWQNMAAGSPTTLCWGRPLAGGQLYKAEIPKTNTPC